MSLRILPPALLESHAKTTLILVAALLCAPVITQGATVISSLPYTISAPGIYLLSNNLAATGTDGIDVNASNVTIDLAGYTIAQTQAGNRTGINVFSGVSNVNIQNGSITGFYTGVFFSAGSEDTMTNVHVLNFTLLGVYVEAADCLIENCIFAGSNQGGFGICLYDCGEVRARNNQISGCSNQVFEALVSKPNALIVNYERIPPVASR